MSKDLLYYCPVDNGDTSLIVLKDKTTLQIDCNIRKSSEGSETDAFDVKEFLLSHYRKGRKYLNDLFILSHADTDHCRGFGDNYFLKDPNNYTEQDYKDGLIIIGELWVTSKIFTYELPEDAKPLRREVKRRIDLIKSNSPRALEEGNRIAIIGYDDDEEKKSVPHYHPGETSNVFNGKTQRDFEFFFHAPFKKDLVDNSADDRNNKSVIVQATFNKGFSEKTAIFGGDADHYIWREVLKQSTLFRDNGSKLDWDFFLAPHHCSWTFFNDTKYVDHPTPVESSLKILDNHGKENGYVIASSKEIKNNDDNPPHWAARREYISHLPKGGSFLNTAAEYNANKKPITFEITNGNIQRTDNRKLSDLTGIHVAGGVGYGTTNTPARHG